MVFQRKDKLGRLSQIADTMQETINKYVQEFKDAAKTGSAIEEADNIMASISSQGKKIMNDYMDNLMRTAVSDDATLEDKLAQYTKLRNAYTAFDKEDLLVPGRHGGLLRDVNEILNTDLQFAENKPIRKVNFAHILDAMDAQMRDIQDQVASRIVGDIQNVVNDGTSNVVTYMQMLLAKNRQFNSLLSKEGVPSEVAMGHILDRLFGGDLGGYNINMGGVDYALSDLVSIARNKTVMQLLERENAGQTKAIMEDVVAYLRSESGVTSSETDVLGEKFLDDFYEYATGKTYAMKETGRLGSVPQFMDVYNQQVFGGSEYIRVETPKIRTNISTRLIDLNVKGIDSDLAKVAMDTSFLEDLAAISTISDDNIEQIIQEGFQRRLLQKYAEAAAPISSEEVGNLSKAYVNILRRVRVLQRATYGYESTAAKIGVQEARAVSEGRVIPRADDIDPVLRTLSERLEDADSLPAPIMSMDDITEETIRRIEELESLAASAADEALGVGSDVVTPGYTRIGSMFKKFISGSGGDFSAMFAANKGKIAIGATAAGLAVLALKIKKDRTPEDISGPPLLPGGNPYETIPSAVSSLPQAPNAESNMGTSYNVSINGDQEQINQFMAAAGSLTNARVQGTIHNSLPNLGGDSYDDIAGSF